MMATATYTADEILTLARGMFPDREPVAADHDDMAMFCDGSPWFVFFGSEESTPERLVFQPKE